MMMMIILLLYYLLHCYIKSLVLIENERFNGNVSDR
jgi:hypothetical protein